ncbi:MAG: hypothetical protein K1W34_15320 [Lachnospiraceae bacterium]
MEKNYDRRIKDFTDVLYLIDEKEVGREFVIIKMLSLNEIMYMNNVKIIVSVAYDYENIKKGLLKNLKKEDIISLDDMQDLRF